MMSVFMLTLKMVLVQMFRLLLSNWGIIKAHFFLLQLLPVGIKLAFNIISIAISYLH